MKLWQVRLLIDEKLNEIAECFTNPKITLVVRAPQLEDGDLIMTNDDLGEAIKAIERLKGRNGRRWELREVTPGENYQRLEMFDACPKCSEGIYKKMSPIRKMLFALWGKRK